MKRSQLLAIGAALLVSSALPAQQRATPQAGRVLPPITHTEYTLPNGLQVVLHQDKSTPIVAVNVWYHVGSKNETLGKTGYAHLFEHMMFQGFKAYDDDYFKPLQEAGGSLNGSTNADRTNYYEVVPSNFLELALFMEAGRMGGLPDALTEEKLANQRDVVKNEKRQNYDNRPYGLVGARINETLYPKDHPYHWLTIGALEDLTAASMDDIKGFFRRYYAPNNASLTIAGDFDPAKARTWVAKYFGSIPKGPAIAKVSVKPVSLAAERRDTMLDRVTLPREYITWHGVPAYHPDEPAMDALANILAGGKSSRLYQILVYEKQIAQDVSAGNPAQELVGRFQVTATAKPTTQLADIEAIIDQEIAKIKATAPAAAEVERFYNEVEASFLFTLQSVQGKADQLNGYNTFRGTPGYFEQDLARYRKVTPADVQRVANKYLTKNRLVLTVLPRPRDAAVAARPAASPIPTTATAVTPGAGAGGAAPGGTTPAAKAGDEAAKAAMLRAALPPAGPDPTFKLPASQRRTLSNGLEVVLIEHHEMPVVGMQLTVRGGAAADPTSQAGLASITADLLDEGTLTRDALTLSRELDGIGARLGTGADWDANSVGILSTARQLDKALSLFADVVLNPALPEPDLNRLRRTRITQLAQRRDDPAAIVGTVYSKLLYGRQHAYGHLMSGDETSLAAITRNDVRSFYDKYYRPNNSTLIVAGDVTMATLIPKLEKAFGGWARGDVAAVDVSSPAPRDKAILYLVDKPGAAQSQIAIGTVGLARTTEDYYPLLVMNTILGGQFSSRVNMNLRENKGYTYGARTGFDYRRGAGPFSATAGVQTAVTKESVVEFLKELKGIRGDIPVTQAELDFAKQSIIRGFPRSFETPEQIAQRLGTLLLYGLPADYYDSYIQNVSAVTIADVQRVAQRYLDPGKMAILVVGDRAVVEKGLREIEGVGSSLVLLDIEGNPVAGVTP
jgi:zinc protease